MSTGTHTAASLSKPPLVIDVRADSRERLLQVAMHLMARNGVAETTVKEISDAAGNRNKSAVAYHFTSKDGLIRAVIQRIHDDVAPSYEAALATLEGQPADSGYSSLQRTVWLLLTPVFALHCTKPYGPDALNVLSRLMYGPLDHMDDEIRARVLGLGERTLRILQRSVPDKPAHIVEFQLHHSIMATVNGLAMHESFRDRHETRWNSLTMTEILLWYVDYVASGLASPTTASSMLSRDEIAEWSRALGLES